jgi:CitMHS family citrate-Mg2+:H+ or citrate-Ca2+:H+ symporter
MGIANLKRVGIEIAFYKDINVDKNNYWRNFMLAFVGFSIIAVILFLIMSKRMSALVALIVVPAIGLIIAGQGAEIGGYIAAGISKMAATGVMFIFSILFFGIMRDNGAFDPIVNKIIKVSKGNPVFITVGTYIIALIGHLDGAGATTFLLTVPAMLPIYEKMSMRRVVLACVVAMGAGVMNLTPWGGPTLRAATALGIDVAEIYAPVIIPQICGIITGLVIAYFLGKKEAKRLKEEGHDHSNLDGEFALEISEEEKLLRRPKLIVFNVLLIVAVIGIMISSIVPPAVAFMIGTAIAMIVNYPASNLQREIVDSHAKEAMMMAGVLFAAGTLTGILQNSGMSSAMAQVMVSIVPESFGKYITVLVGYLSVPLSMVFDPDSYYFGVMPVIAETVQKFGIPAVDIARASIAGQITVGFPVSPLTPSTFLLIGLAGVDLGEHQKFTFKYLWLISAVIVTVMILTGVFTL